MSDDQSTTILVVDDEPLVRHTIRDTLLEYRPRVRVVEAPGGPEALALLETAGPVQLVISDMRMPGMDGATLLEKVRETQHTATRILLTAYADVPSAQAAINQGGIFRFLSKPCPTDTLVAAVDDGLREEARVTAERRLLEDTLRGSVKALADVLALADPATFGRTERVRRHVSALLERLGAADRWAIEVAASLCQIGWIALPPDTARRLANGEELSVEERRAATRTPRIASEILSHIPRLESVRAILEAQDVDVELGMATAAPDGLPLGVRVLRAARDFETHRARGLHPAAALRELAARSTTYGEEVLAAFRALPAPVEDRQRVVEVSLRDLRIGMRLAADVFTSDGLKILREGNDLSGPLLERIRTFRETAGIQEPLKVYVNA